MALRWNLEGIANHDEVCFYEATKADPNHGVEVGDRMMNPVTNALIWATIGVDLPGIPEGDAAEFFARLRFTEQVNGPMLIRAEGEDGKRPEGEAAFITEAEVYAHIGLVCNVSKLTRTKWLAKFNGDLDRYASRFETKRERAKAAVEAIRFEND